MTEPLNKDQVQTLLDDSPYIGFMNLEVVSMDLDKDELSQLQRLHDMKQQGSQRQSPAATPVRKSISCTLCKIQFYDEENLRKHKVNKHTAKKDTEKEKGRNALLQKCCHHLNAEMQEEIDGESDLVQSQEKEGG